MIVVFKGDGPCPACGKTVAALEKAGIPHMVNESTGALFQIGAALGVAGRPIMVWVSVGWGEEAEAIIKAARGETKGGYL